jgi:hypothetical protein
MNRRTLIAVVVSVATLVLVFVAFAAPRPPSAGTRAVPQAATAQPLASPVTGAQPQTGPATYAISVDQAGVIALAGAPGVTLTGTPAIVTYQGVVAYEVQLSTGMAYVDAATGQVLAAPAATGTGGGATTGEGGEGQGEGGEGQDDDDDD